MKKRIAIFGSTGSIGTQALEVIEANAELFSVEILTAYNNEELLIKQALKFWRRMSVEDPEGIYSSVTHPSNAERFVALQKTLEEINYKRKHKIPLLPDFKAVSK